MTLKSGNWECWDTGFKHHWGSWKIEAFFNGSFSSVDYCVRDVLLSRKERGWKTSVMGMLHRSCKSGRKDDPDGDTVSLKGPWQERNAFEFKRKLGFWHADLLSFKNRYAGHWAFLEQWQNCPKAWCQGISEYHIWNKAKKCPSLWSAAGKITAELKHWNHTWKLQELWILLCFTKGVKKSS